MLRSNSAQVERTLILLKPDCVQKKICGKVIARFEDAGFRIVGCKMMALSSEILREHYAHIADKPFYPSVEEFMQSSPIIALVLEGEDVVNRVREMLGVTDSAQAAQGTIRAEWGSKDSVNSKMKNIAHASDSREAAAQEVKRFFGADEIHT